MYSIVRAQLPHLDLVAPLFNAYRIFYERPADIAGARRFIKERLQNQDSVIFLAQQNAATPRGLGFLQIYPTLASLGMHKMLVVNDLFVDPAYRGHGVGRALMRRATAYAHEIGVPRLTLSTANTNTIGQKLYESEGYVQETDFLHYSLKLTPKLQQDQPISSKKKI